jgi:hypothetical protein
MVIKITEKLHPRDGSVAGTKSLRAVAKRTKHAPASARAVVACFRVRTLDLISAGYQVDY